MKCATTAAAPILSKTISGLRKSLGTQRGIARIIESEVPELKALTKAFEPLFAADFAAHEARTKLAKKLDTTLGKVPSRDMEATLAHVLNPEGATTMFGSGAADAGARLTDDLVGILREAGMNETQAIRFLRKDVPKLRAMGGDMTKLDPNFIVPETFQPFINDIRNGVLDVTSNNAYVFSRQLVDAVARNRYLKPVVKEVRKEVASWQGLKELNPGDVRTAQQFIHDVINSRISQQDQLILNSVATFKRMIENLEPLPGAKKIADLLDDETIIRAAQNATTYFSGFAMSANPALVMRQLMQPVMGMMKVGASDMAIGYRRAYARGDKAEAFRERAARAMNISTENPVMIAETADSVLSSKMGRAVIKAQQLGLLPYRWGDKMNRFASFASGEASIERHAPKYLEGKLSWEEFLFETGLKGSPKVDQRRIQALLDAEVPNVAKAAEEYGKVLALDTQFLYSAMNAPQAFRGTLGRMVGQFGMFPVSFGEFMVENAFGARDGAWAFRFGTRFAAIQASLMAASKATGVDTSTWLFASPLTFEGGPWFQTFRDISTLAVSTNEFERREATSKLRKVFGNSTAGFMGGVFNPFGGTTTNLFQAMAESDPRRALLLGLGFNLKDVSLATRR